MLQHMNRIENILSVEADYNPIVVYVERMLPVPSTVKHIHMKNCKIIGDLALLMTDHLLTLRLDGVTLSGIIAPVQSVELISCTLEQEYRPNFNNMSVLSSLSVQYGNITLIPRIEECTELRELLLSNIDLSNDSLDMDWASLKKLTMMTIFYCTLSCDIPEWLCNLSSLRDLTGTIPRDIVNLTNLQSLYLTNNYLSGELPYSMSRLTNLQELHLDHNRLTVTLDSISNLSTLCSLDLRGNEFSYGK